MTEQKQWAMQHPVFKDCVRLVNPDEADSWKGQGWKRVSRDLADDPRQAPTTTGPAA